MKNLKRLMSVVLSVVMLLSFVISTSAATFTDVAESDKAFDAVEILAALKILEGKEAGVFDPDANIKRSEFAAVICRAMNQSPVGVASFTDVATDHWAYNYIAWAASQKIVNGRGDGTFDPDANVTYNEAIAMIVRAMGYEYYVEEYLGGFPTGYARVAGSYKIDADVNTTNGNAAATRADVASLVYNAFEAPLMDYSYAIGSDMEYVIYDGSKNVENEKRTLLSYYSDIYKFKVIVGKTFKNDSKYTDNKGNKLMDLTIKSTYGFKPAYLADAFENFLSVNLTTGNLNETGFTKVIANNEAWADYSGYTVDAYLTVNADGKVEVVAMVPASAGDEVVIANAREAITTSVVDGGVVFEYDDENGVEQELDILFDAGNSKYADVYVNKISEGKVNAGNGKTAFEALDDGAYAQATFVDTDNDGYFDKIYLVDYTYAIVDEVDVDYEIIKTSGNDIALSEDDTKPGFTYTIYKDGEKIGLEDLVAGDMLNMVIGGDDLSEATFADIYVTNNTIESNVASTSDSAKGTKFTIDGEVYYLAKGARSDAKSLGAGDAGIFYITIDGYIFDVDYTSTHSDNYAMILDLGSTDSLFGGGKAWQIKLLTKNNEVKTLPVKSTLYVTYATPILEDDLDTDDIDETDYYELVARESLKNADLDTFMNGIEALFSYDGDGVDDAADLAAAQAALVASAPLRMVTFKEVSGEITELVFAADLANCDFLEEVSDRVFTLDEEKADAEYIEKNNRLDNKKLLDSTVLFNLPLYDANDDIINVSKVDTDEDIYKFDADKAQVYAASSLRDEAEYKAYLYDVEKTGLSAVLLTDKMSFAGNTSALALVASIADGLDADGNQAKMVTFVQAGETQTLVLNEDVIAAGGDLETISVGDVFQYNLNAADEIASGLLIYEFNAETKGGTLAIPSDGDVEYIVGIVEDNDGSEVDFVDASTWYTWNLDAEGTNAMLDIARFGKASAFSTKNSTSYIRKSTTKAFEGGTTYNSDVYVVVAKYVDSEIVDVVSYRYDKDFFVTSKVVDDATVYTVHKTKAAFDAMIVG